MTEPIDCPICMDAIDINKNCTRTECGHCFHASCLMTSVAHNGFGCPYCRTVMADVPEDEEDEYVHDEEEDEETFTDYALRGFRFLFNNLNGEEHDDEDNLEEDEEDEEGLDEDEEEEDENPPLAFIMQRLLEQGITMEKLVASCLVCHEEYEEKDLFVNADREIFGKLRVIISNYIPPAADLPEEVEAAQVEVVPLIV